MTLADRLKTARESIGKNQKDMAGLCHASYRTWQGYEAGETPPTAKTIEALVKLGFNANWLLTGDGPIKGFTASTERVMLSDKPVVNLDVSEEMLDEVSRIFNEKVGDRKSEISSDKLIILITTMSRIYSRNFIESADFRRDTIEKNIESLVKLALPEK